MALANRIKTNLQEAQRNKDTLKVSVLRMVNAAILDREKEKRAKLSKGGLSDEEKLIEQSKLTDGEIVEVISSQSKKRKEAIAGFEKGGRAEQAEQEKKELEVLMEYMPEQMGGEEIKKLVQEAITESKASSPQDMGKVMAVLMPKVKGRADGSLVSKIVQEELNK